MGLDCRNDLALSPRRAFITLSPRTTTSLQTGARTQTPNNRLNTKPHMRNLDQILTSIANEHFFVDTLETRNSGDLDFHNTAVWCMKSALEAAFKAGLEAAFKAGVETVSVPNGSTISNTPPNKRKAKREPLGI